MDSKQARNPTETGCPSPELLCLLDQRNLPERGSHSALLRLLRSVRLPQLPPPRAASRDAGLLRLLRWDSSNAQQLRQVVHGVQLLQLVSSDELPIFVHCSSRGN